MGYKACGARPPKFPGPFPVPISKSVLIRWKLSRDLPERNVAQKQKMENGCVNYRQCNLSYISKRLLMKFAKISLMLLKHLQIRARNIIL